MSTHRASPLGVVRALALVCACTATRASAQATPPTPDVVPVAPAAPAATEVPPAPGSDAAAKEPAPPSAAELYDAAFDALARGERDLAVSLLRELARMPDPLAVRARDLLVAMTVPPPYPAAPTRDAAEVAPADDDAPVGERTTGAARAELVFFQTVHGIALGAETCAMALCEGAQPWVLSLMLGAGTGFGTSWYLSKDGVTPGLARATTDGTWWGAANGGLLLMATGAATDSRDEEVAVGAYLAGGQIVGLVLGGVAYSQFKPTTGQVSFTASGGLWTLAVTAELLGLIQPDFDERGWGWILAGAGNLGVVGGALFAAEHPMSTSRVLLIDAGGLLGTLTGIGVSVLAQGDNVQAEPTFGLGLAGTLLGLGLAFHLSSGWDDGDADASGPRLALVPLPGGAQLTLSAPWF